MAQQQIAAASIFDINLRARIVALVSLTVLATLLAVVPTAEAQTFTMLHTFTGGQDGVWHSFSGAASRYPLHRSSLPVGRDGPVRLHRRKR
jgi:hypothetical protein